MPEPAPRKLTVPPHPLDIKRRLRRDDDNLGPYYEAIQQGCVVGIIAKTGSHLDDYPWDWYLPEGVDPIPGRKGTGVADTLGHALDAVGYSLGNFYGRSGQPVSDRG